MRNILLIGNSCKEDSISWKLNEENNVGNIFITPGNAGCYFKSKTRNIILNPDNKKEISEFLIKEKINYINLTSLNFFSNEIEDIASELKIPLIGPSKRIKSFFNSRINIKNFLKKYSINTLYYQVIDNFTELKNIVENFSSKKFISSDIQNGFKGFYLIESKGQGIKILEFIQTNRAAKDSKFIVENYQKGEEFSAIIVLDGLNYILFPVLRIYPKSFDNDYGLYTSGMGAFTPCPSFNNNDITLLNEKIIFPLIEGLKEEKLLYKGFMTIHFIKSMDRLFVLNILPTLNSPEIETLIPLFNSSFNDLCLSIISQNLINYTLKLNPLSSLSVVLASKGYPIDSEKGVLIAGLDKNYEGINVFFNKTSIINYSKNRGFISSGGRVLTLNSIKPKLEDAYKAVYEILENNKIFFDGNFYRSDIGEKYFKK
ncbi:MAG: phosphoribosylglycinamide synthetase C domain-containing protein [Exilispira sp.]